MQQYEDVFAFFDDVYVSSPPDPTRVAYDALADTLLSTAGIQLHTSMTHVSGGS